jgi:riboflavin kinase/FMN adenylyltransferase
MLSGKVIKGKQLGKSLGYPTANLQIEEDYKIIPKEGVFVVKSTIDEKEYYGMMNIGHNPTVGEGNRKSIESYFFDFNQDIYHKNIRVEVLKRIRDEKKFDSLDNLKTAMKNDEIFAKQYIDKYA